MLKTKLVKIDVQPENIDWERIGLFKKRFEILWDNFQDLKMEVFSGTFSKDSNGKYIGKFNLPNEHRLKGLYVDYRHFYSKDESTNFFKFVNYISSLTHSKDYRYFLEKEKKKWRSELIEKGWFNYKGEKFKTDDILNIWFNSEIFHNDKNKKAILSEWLEILDVDTAKSILFLVICDTLLCIRNINWSISELEKQHLFLKMPDL